MPRFVADSMLGRLAKWLRALGFDVFYDPFLDDHNVIAEARRRGAIALTRDTGFPRPANVRVFFVEHDDVADQLEQIARDLPLDLSEARPLTRCTVCNHELEPASRDEVWDRIPPFIYLTCETYSQCPHCGRVYWEGTHAPRIRAQLDRLREAAERHRSQA